MMNYATQRHLSHVLLIDSESAGTMRTLAENALDLHAELGEVSGVSPYGRYTLILSYPTSRSDLAKTASEIEQRCDSVGAKCVINALHDADMSIVQGKAGLLSCSLWLLAGAVLVNDAPIRAGSAYPILSAANQTQGVHPVGGSLQAAVISNQSDINQRLLRLREGHDLGDMLRAMGVSSSPDAPSGCAGVAVGLIALSIVAGGASWWWMW